MTTHHRLPADYSRCVNAQCSMRHTCLRWLCRDDNLRSSVTNFPAWPMCVGAWIPASEQPQPTTPKQ